MGDTGPRRERASVYGDTVTDIGNQIDNSPSVSIRKNKFVIPLLFYRKRRGMATRKQGKISLSFSGYMTTFSVI